MNDPQHVMYPDAAAVREVEHTLSTRAPLAAPADVDELRRRLAAVARGEAFLLQAGDCAERFSELTRPILRQRLRVLLALRDLLQAGLSRPVVTMGRLAGQFAKPRSSLTERVMGHEIPAFRGDLINRPEPTLEARRPDPTRMLEGHRLASGAVAILDSLLASPNSLMRADEDVVSALKVGPGKPGASAFEVGTGKPGGRVGRTVYLAHEALLLPYERGLTRLERDVRYGLSAHFLWIGARTRHPTGVHAEFMSSIANPIGIKLGPDTNPDDLIALARRLDPNAEPGRLTLITRFGAGHVRAKLPRLLDAVSRAGYLPVWCCDPMHGNTVQTEQRRKTRRLDDVRRELDETLEVHASCGTYLGGVHLEVAGGAVTECVGGILGITEGDLERRYETACDPRLNPLQALELLGRAFGNLHPFLDEGPAPSSRRGAHQGDSIAI